ncbi:hypothetical protein [Bradyrhizobium sp. Leo170]|uniref:hypothetical protein n=1 Tax=Bradyrhizobium sp. Leo170 TaxID=1571199 RepID=UPI00102EC0AC|nr:hypothetical protein [Bradyrhizobium sp. Leo170]TAI67632.1 hypothetical protein CWO89_02105 [Bradyrhizobium sp. Leo170]
MTFYRTCTGCVVQGQPCDARDGLRKKLKGLGVTSVKWKCADRIARFQVGDLVWVDTVADPNDYGDDGEPYRDEFPGVIVDAAGAKPLVFIDPGVKGKSEEAAFVAAKSNGFCRIPLSRLKEREGEKEKICQSCQWPEWKGHHPGFSCAISHKSAEDNAPF